MANYVAPFQPVTNVTPKYWTPVTGPAATSTKVTYTKMNPIYQKGSKSYDTYKGSDGNYYYKDGSTYVKADSSMSKTIADNKKICFGTPTQANANKTYTETKNTTSSTPATSSGGGSSSGGGGGGRSSVNDSYYEKLLNEYKQKIDELEHPKVWTADELAELYGVQDQYNYDKILQMYNDATNKYYTDAIASQIGANMDAERSNASYGEALLKSYLSGYNNAAPTAVGRGTLAANALSTMLGADKANEEASSNLNSIVNSYREAWNNEIANNKTTARDQYNTVGTWLLNQGAKMNTADVQNYINTLNAYDTAYSGIRNAQNNLASTAAAAYQNNANAALARNQYDQANAMAKYYKAYYGTENNAWQKAYRNVLNDQATSTAAKSSAN